MDKACYYNSELVEMYIDVFENIGYNSFLGILPNKKKFLKDYYRFHILKNEKHKKNYYNMYCELSKINN